MTTEGAIALCIDILAKAAPNAERPAELDGVATALRIAARRDLAGLLWGEGFAGWLDSKNAWSRSTFGEGARVEGVCRHIEKELAEIRANPGDLVEWIDVVLLALDGAFRCAGGDGARISEALRSKQAENEVRRWGTPGPPDQPVEHVREPGCSAAAGCRYTGAGECPCGFPVRS